MTLPPLPALVREIENCITARHLDAALALCSNLRAAIAAVPAQPVSSDVLREALSFYADETRYHGPNHTLDAADKWTEQVGLKAYRLDVTRDRGVIAKKALAAAPQAVPVPAGMALAPVNATAAMNQAADRVRLGDRESGEITLSWDEYEAIYRAMLAAAPKEQPHE